MLAVEMSEARAPWIVAIGCALPPRSVNNADLPSSLGTDPAAIEKKTGIRSRRWAPEGVYTSDLGAEACRAACTAEGIPLDSIDCIIAATQSADHAIPGIGVIIQHKLGMSEVPCFDLRNQCSNFLYALQIARGFILAGVYRRILIVCAEIQSHALGMEPSDAAITPLFGDGAAAAVVADVPLSCSALRVRWCEVGADGRGADKLRHRVWDVSQVPAWDISRLPDAERRIRYAEMNGEAVFRAAVKGMVDGAKRCLAGMEIEIGDIDLVVPHQANASINKTVTSILGVAPARVASNIAELGNVAGASLPLLLAQVLEAGGIAPGERVLLMTFGAGYTWGTALVEAIHAG